MKQCIWKFVLSFYFNLTVVTGILCFRCTDLKYATVQEWMWWWEDEENRSVISKATRAWLLSERQWLSKESCRYRLPAAVLCADLAKRVIWDNRKALRFPRQRSRLRWSSSVSKLNECSAEALCSFLYFQFKFYSLWAILWENKMHFLAALVQFRLNSCSIGSMQI